MTQLLIHPVRTLIRRALGQVLSGEGNGQTEESKGYFQLKLTTDPAPPGHIWGHVGRYMLREQGHLHCDIVGAAISSKEVGPPADRLCCNCENFPLEMAIGQDADSTLWR